MLGSCPVHFRTDSRSDLSLSISAHPKKMDMGMCANWSRVYQNVIVFQNGNKFLEKKIWSPLMWFLILGMSRAIFGWLLTLQMWQSVIQGVLVATLVHK